MTLVFIDVDGTLIDPPGSEPAFILHLLASGVLGPRQALAAGAFAVGRLPALGCAVFKKNKAYLTGLEVEKVATLAQAFVTRRIGPRLRGWVLDRLADHRRRGEGLVLLTGTPDFIATPIAHLIGAERVAATRCASVDGRFLPALPSRHPFGTDKVRCAEAVCRELGAPLEGCAAYADADSDLALLRSVGRPVAVHPSPGLRRAAWLRGWEILDPPAMAPHDRRRAFPTGNRGTSSGGRNVGSD